MFCTFFTGIQEDPDTIDRLIADGEAKFNKWRHPDPYIGKSYGGNLVLHRSFYLWLMLIFLTRSRPRKEKKKKPTN